MLRQMIVQLFLFNKTFGTTCTLVRLHEIVFRYVDLQVLATIKLFRTNVAEILFALVHLDVPQKTLS